MSTKRKVAIIVVLVVAIAAITAYTARDSIERYFLKPTGSSLPQGVAEIKNRADVEIIAQGLTVPWEVVFLPEGDQLVSERSGTLRRIGQNKQAYPISGVSHVGEGGLLGVVLHPRFIDNGWVYLYMTTVEGELLINRIERYRYDSDSLSERKVILSNIPGARNHDGGRIAFGPDGQLYVTTGDAGKDTLAQDTNSLAGKILRLTDEGMIPSDNPFKNAVYSYGHRNPQGLAWDDKGQLWSSEHGRSGAKSGFDEINFIKRGGNYGWPVIEGDASKPGMEKPVVHSGADETWAPASLAFLDGSLYFGGLRGQALYQAQVKADNSLELRTHLAKQYGRIRAVSISPDKFIYISTSNTDGRGTKKPNDDKVIRLNPSIFKK